MVVTGDGRKSEENPEASAPQNSKQNGICYLDIFDVIGKPLSSILIFLS